jgi:hypothetical protein
VALIGLNDDSQRCRCDLLWAGEFADAERAEYWGQKRLRALRTGHAHYLAVAPFCWQTGMTPNEVLAEVQQQTRISRNARRLYVGAMQALAKAGQPMTVEDAQWASLILLLLTERDDGKAAELGMPPDTTGPYGARVMALSSLRREGKWDAFKHLALRAMDMVAEVERHATP